MPLCLYDFTTSCLYDFMTSYPLIALCLYVSVSLRFFNEYLSFTIPAEICLILF